MLQRLREAAELMIVAIDRIGRAELLQPFPIGFVIIALSLPTNVLFM
ncbi:hypothetical protein [Rhizobium sp. K102]|nr:hypothetical protein [Rhizobium sp. K102]ULR47173.1 hypothetical protein MHI61_27580 [Rhizobium sp. K102]